jgi:hypothetical protein
MYHLKEMAAHQRLVYIILSKEINLFSRNYLRYFNKVLKKSFLKAELFGALRQEILLSYLI